ncbi:MAG: carboxypeptidase-like regulatory domain-containing protein [Gemmatimonadales bacterium]
MAMLHADNLVVVAVTATLLAAGPPTASLRAQASTPHRVAGIVIDQARTPVPGAELTLRRGSQSMKTRSNDSGRFDFGQLSSGPVAIAVHRLGFRERTVNVEVGSAAAQSDLEIDLLAIPADIEAVVIDGTGGRLQEFAEHRKQRKFGHFFDQNEIRSKNPRFVSELFRGIPGARLFPAAGGGSRLLLRECRPRIWLDGVVAQDAEIDEVIAPSEIAGIEIYSSWAGIPAQYQDRENRACGVVLIWSRQS